MIRHPDKCTRAATGFRKGRTAGVCTICALLHISAGTHYLSELGKGSMRGESIVASRHYLKQRAANLLILAQATKNPDVAAAMIAKAADLAAEAEAIQAQDPSPRPPDVEAA